MYSIADVLLSVAARRSGDANQRSRAGEKQGFSVAMKLRHERAELAER